MNQIYYYWLSTVEGIGHIRMKQIMDYFGSLQDAWCAKPEDFRCIPGLPDKIINQIFIRKGQDMIREIEGYKNKGIDIVTIECSEYPERLKEIFDPPYVLYFKGMFKECKKYVAVVGSRHCTSYGRMVARNITRELCSYDIGIISGMARGIDTEAHIGTLEGRGFTCAVLGCGCDIAYPPENKKLMMEIESSGTVISEYPPGTGPSPYNFPARNRIISGLSDGVLIVEAGEKSGALITANFALEQGRDVFAVPGSILSSPSKGTNLLIKDGAKLVTNIEDILSELGIEERESKKTNNVCMTPGEKALMDIIEDNPLYVDELFRKISLKVGEVNSLLTALEIKGLIKILPGRFVVRTPEL